MPSTRSSYKSESAHHSSLTTTTRSSTKLSRKKNDNDQGEKFELGWRGVLAFFTLAVLALMAALDGTSLSVALPAIAKALKGTAIEAFWSGTSFLLCSTVFQPSFASLSCIFGRRPMVLVSLLMFFIGTVFCAIAKSFTFMLVGRSLQGSGGGGIIALSEVIVTDLVPLRLRGKYFGILSAMWSLGSVSGPILGGGFAEKVSWRWIFYINFPFIGIGVIFVFFFLNLRRMPGSLVEKLRRIDYIGTFLFISSMASLLIPLTWGGISYPWNSWHTIVPLVVGAAGLVLFGFYEYRFARDPIVPPMIFNNRTATVSFIGSALQGFILWCSLYYMPLYFEAVKEYNPVITGVALFPATFTVAPSAMIVGAAISRTGRYRWAIWSGWVVSTIGLGLVCLIKVNTSIHGWILLNIVPGLGLGILFPSLGYAVQAAAVPKNVPIAVAMFSFFRALGQAIGVAIGGVIFQNRMRANLLKYSSLAARASEYSQDAAGLVQVIQTMTDSGEKSDLKTAYTDSLRTVWAVNCVISGIALLLSLFTEAYDLNCALESAQGLRRSDHHDDHDGRNSLSEKEIEANLERALYGRSAPWAY